MPAIDVNPPGFGIFSADGNWFISPTLQTDSMSVSLTNHEAGNYSQHANFVYSEEYTSPLLDLLNARPGESIVDLGCGTGQLTERIKAIVGDRGLVCGVDSSKSMLDRARDTGGPLGIQYLQGDIQDYSTLDPSLEGKFDAVFTSATLHWCKSNPGGVVDTMQWLLKPGGRVVFEFGGFGNTAGVRTALHEVIRRRGLDPVEHDPWYFPTISQYQEILENHGFHPGSIQLVPRPTPLPTDMIGWLKTFARNTFFAKWKDDEAEQMMKETADICRPDTYWSSASPGSGSKPRTGSDYKEGWEIMYVRLRGVATVVRK